MKNLSVVVCATLFFACGAARVEDASHTEHFVVVNGVRLHYIDWGGQGECLLFLTPLGGDLLEQFGSLAPRFTDRFRVLGLTRRGQGQSDKPNGGYDTDTLVRDIVAFLDAMGVAKAHVAGQSIAGAEMTRLATEYPSRVSTLVYLDAAVDYQASAALAKEAGMGPPDDPALAAILQGAGVRPPEYKRVQAPALNIAVVFDGPIPVRPEDDEAYKRFVKLAEERDIVGARIRQFEQGTARGESLILRNTTHGGFVAEREQQEVFVPVMREFLLRPFAALLSVGDADVATLQRAATQGPGGLNPRIPAAIHASYQGIRDAQDWLNPKITVRAEGIEVESPGIPRGRKTVAADELRNLLISLPVTAWPYGRVVLASDIGLRRADRSDDEPIRRNHEAAEKILEALDVKVDWWPS